MSGDRYPTWEARDCDEFRMNIKAACDAVIEEIDPGVSRRRLEGDLDAEK